MATWNDVRRIALALPGTTEVAPEARARWCVRDKLFVWERPLRPADLQALGKRAPAGPILGVRTANLEAKEALLQAEPRVYFTTPHFDGYPAVLVRLGAITRRKLEELIVEAWLCRAPKRLVREYLEAQGGRRASASRSRPSLKPLFGRRS